MGAAARMPPANYGLGTGENGPWLGADLCVFLPLFTSECVSRQLKWQVMVLIGAAEHTCVIDTKFQVQYYLFLSLPIA